MPIAAILHSGEWNNAARTFAIGYNDEWRATLNAGF